MTNTDNVSEEIVIVGSQNGELADVINPLYRQGEPIKESDIRKAIGDNIVYLMPVNNLNDDQMVGVYSQTEKLLGYVWMYQAPAMMSCLERNNHRYVAVRINEVIPEAKVLIAVSEQCAKVPFVERTASEVDEHWAMRLPEVLKSISGQCPDLCLQLLHDELTVALKWNNLLKHRIDNLLRAAPLDLSSYRYQEYMEVYAMMKHSAIKEVRAQSGYLLNTIVYSGSEEHMKWWMEEWLPSFFHEAAEGDLLGMFEADHYTLDRVEGLLDAAPAHLFHLYKVNPLRFANKLYCSALPQAIYNRLLTLLAVRELMIEKRESQQRLQREESLSSLSDSKRAILNEIDKLIDRGDWVSPASDDCIKAYMRQVLGLGPQCLTTDEKVMSSTLWKLLENRKGGNAVRVTWQNLIGYFAERGLVNNHGGSPMLNKMFFYTDEGYSNIDKGRPCKNNLLKDLKVVLPLLDTYCPRR